MSPFIPGLSFPLTINFGSHKKDSDEKTAVPAAAPSATPAVSCNAWLDLDQLLMVGIVISILILCTAVVVYAARH
jgi:hypothetical protein